MFFEMPVIIHDRYFFDLPKSPSPVIGFTASSY